MTSAPGRRTPPANTPTVAVTGALSPVGAAATAWLSASPGVGRVVAIDTDRGETTGVTWRLGDVADPTVVQHLAGVDVVVHAALELDPDVEAEQRARRMVDGTRTVVTAAAAAGVRRAVIVTSAMVYGASADNEVPLDEGSPLAATPEGLPGDLLEMEDVARAARRIHPGLDVVVLRPAALVGPGVDSLVSRHFAAPRLLAVREAAMAWQFCHVDDLATAIEAAVLGQVDGDAAVGCDGWMSDEDVQRACGLRRVELPAAIAFGTAERLHRAGVVPTPASELAYVTYPWVVATDRLHASGWKPRHDNGTALQELLASVEGERAVAGRRLGLKDATIAGAGAAGATVAVLGAAAFVRRARRLRGL